MVTLPYGTYGIYHTDAGTFRLTVWFTRMESMTTSTWIIKVDFVRIIRIGGLTYSQEELLTIILKQDDSLGL